MLACPARKPRCAGGSVDTRRLRGADGGLTSQCQRGWVGTRILGGACSAATDPGPRHRGDTHFPRPRTQRAPGAGEVAASSIKWKSAAREGSTSASVFRVALLPLPAKHVSGGVQDRTGSVTSTLLAITPLLRGCTCQQHKERERQNSGECRIMCPRCLGHHWPAVESSSSREPLQ